MYVLGGLQVYITLPLKGKIDICKTINIFSRCFFFFFTRERETSYKDLTRQEKQHSALIPSLTMLCSWKGGGNCSSSALYHFCAFSAHFWWVRVVAAGESNLYHWINFYTK